MAQWRSERLLLIRGNCALHIWCIFQQTNHLVNSASIYSTAPFIINKEPGPDIRLSTNGVRSLFFMPPVIFHFILILHLLPHPHPHAHAHAHHFHLHTGLALFYSSYTWQSHFLCNNWQLANYSWQLVLFLVSLVPFLILPIHRAIFSSLAHSKLVLSTFCKRTRVLHLSPIESRANRSWNWQKSSSALWLNQWQSFGGRKKLAQITWAPEVTQFVSTNANWVSIIFSGKRSNRLKQSVTRYQWPCVLHVMKCEQGEL